MSDKDILNLIAELKELKLRELQVLATLEAILPAKNNAQPAPPSVAQTQLFQIGDLVVITN
jgi:hypothetical protein